MSRWFQGKSGFRLRFDRVTKHNKPSSNRWYDDAQARQVIERHDRGVSQLRDKPGEGQYHSRREKNSSHGNLGFHLGRQFARAINYPRTVPRMPEYLLTLIDHGFEPYFTPMEYVDMPVESTVK
jgi:hypothetical protein